MRKLINLLGLMAALVVGASAIAQATDSDCCKPGAACCKPGAPCCPKN